MTSYERYRADKILFYLENIRNGSRVFPPSLQISLTDHCFNRCAMCTHWQRRDKHSLPIADLLNFLNVAKTHGLQSVCYSGGDPMAYQSRLNDVMMWHIINDIPFGLITAGIVPDAVDRDLLSKAEWVRISLDGINPETYGNLRGSDLHVTLQSIRSLNRSNLEFGITLSTINYRELMDLARTARNLLIKTFRVWPVRHSESLVIHQPDMDYLLSIGKFLDCEGISHNMQDCIDILMFGELQPFKRCLAILFQSFIDASGRIFPCCITAGDSHAGPLVDFDLGNILNFDVEYLHKKALAFSLQDQLPNCCAGCIKRLQTINVVAEEHWHDKLFL